MSVAFDTNVDITVEIGFDSDPFDEVQSFTDISQYVRQFSTNRGRVNELGQFGAGSAQIMLSNTDNRFNPSQTTYYYDTVTARTKIQPLKRVRISATYSSNTYVLFEGFLDTIPVVFTAQGQDSVVTFRATDAFKIFQSGVLDSRSWRLGRVGFSELGSSTRLGYEDIQELSSDRVTRILNTIGFPSNRRDILTGTNNVQTQSLTDNILTALREVETAENAQFFISADGKATFRNRNYRLSNTKAVNVQGTFSNTGTDLPYTDVSLSLDDNEIVNLYEWTREGGSTQYASDADSVLRFTVKGSTKTTINVSDADVLSIIQQKIADTALPIVRVDKLTVNPRDDVSLWTQVLDREFGDRIKVKIQDPSGTTLEDELLIESIQHTVNGSSQSWSWSATLSPAGSSAWVLGSAKLGEGTRFAYS